MGQFADRIRIDVKEIHRILGTYFIWQGEEIPCGISSSADTFSAEPDSILNTLSSEYTITVLIDEFENFGMKIPDFKQGDKVEVVLMTGEQLILLVDRNINKPGDPQLILACNRPTSK